MKAAAGLLLLVILAACNSSEAPPASLVCVDPVRGCALQADDKLAHLRFSELPKPLRPFDLELIMEAESVEASFQMQGMEMGLNRYRLLADAGKWHAHIILPACMQGRSDWELLLDVTIAGKPRRYRVPFKSG